MAAEEGRRGPAGRGRPERRSGSVGAPYGLEAGGLPANERRRLARLNLAGDFRGEAPVNWHRWLNKLAVAEWRRQWSAMRAARLPEQMAFVGESATTTLPWAPPTGPPRARFLGPIRAPHSRQGEAGRHSMMLAPGSTSDPHSCPTDPATLVFNLPIRDPHPTIPGPSMQTSPPAIPRPLVTSHPVGDRLRWTVARSRKNSSSHGWPDGQLTETFSWYPIRCHGDVAVPTHPDHCR